jgi:hypothetical protein
MGQKYDLLGQDLPWNLVPEDFGISNAKEVGVSTNRFFKARKLWFTSSTSTRVELFQADVQARHVAQYLRCNEPNSS